MGYSGAVASENSTGKRIRRGSQDFQRAVLNRIHRMHADPSLSRRPVLFVCDEYQAFATTGENEPPGDEKFFALARQAKCIPIVATQSR